MDTSKLKRLIYSIGYKNIGIGKLYYWYDLRFNPIVKKQRLDFTEIPLLINNFNQLHYLKGLINFFLERGFKNIIILDNNSTYKPLLDYYEEIKNAVTVIKLGKNEGHRALFNHRKILSKYCKGYYFLSDADCVPYGSMPDDFVHKAINLLDEFHINITKVGFALNTDDIPDSYLHKKKVLEWEKRFWMKTVKPEIYDAPVDTTLALYKPKYGLRRLRSPFLLGIRIGGRYSIKHGGWYIDGNNLTDEEIYYKNSVTKVSTWFYEEKK